MTPRSTTGVRAALLALTASLAAVATGMLITLADSNGDLGPLIGSCVAVAAVGALFAVPTRLLPSITLLITLLVPTEATFFPHLLQGATLGAVPLAVWIIRAPRLTQTPSVFRIQAYLLGVWLVLSEVFAHLRTHRGWEWLGVAIIALVLPFLRTPGDFDLRRFRAYFLTATTFLGVYALIEGFFLHSNPLFGGLFIHTVWWPRLHFNASYRVTTLLGHPLVNGTVFSAAAVLAASSIVKKHDTPLVALLRFGILTGAVLVTHSRGPAVALAIGVAVVIVFEGRQRQGYSIRRLVLVISAIAGLAFVAIGLEARDESRQGRTSAESRVDVIPHTIETLHHVGPFGAGPGESGSYRTSLNLPGSHVALENSYAQLAVSLGPIGLLIVLALLGSVIVAGLRVESMVGEAATLLTILVAIAGYNAIEEHRIVIILISLFVIAILTGIAKSAELLSSQQFSSEPMGGMR